MKIKKFIFSIFKKGIKFISGHGLTRLYPFRVVYFSLISFLRDPNSPIDVLGQKMFLDPIDSLGLSIRGIYEPFETAIIQKEIKEGNFVLDLGANVGYYTLIFAKLVGKKGKVFAFEPDPDNFAILKKNIEMNGYKNVNLIQKAVSNKIGKGKLYLDKYNKGAQTIYDLNNDREFIEIETTRLDDYFKKYDGKIDFIKMDIEGAEALAIGGMPLLLEKNKNIKIFTEFFPLLLGKSGTEPEKFLEFFINLNFKIFNLDEKEKKVKSVGIDELLTKYQNSYTNLLCIR